MTGITSSKMHNIRSPYESTAHPLSDSPQTNCTSFNSVGPNEVVLIVQAVTSKPRNQETTDPQFKIKMAGDHKS